VDTLVDLEKQYWKAIQAKDVEAALRLSDDTCIVVGAQGVGRIDRKTMGAMMQSAAYTLDAFDFHREVQVQMLGDDTAVLAYRVREDLHVDGKPVTLEAADSSTWVRRNGRWVCALHTESIIGDPFGRDRRSVQTRVDGVP
jgi:hypothetical protein